TGVTINTLGQGYTVTNGLATTGGHGSGARINITYIKNLDAIDDRLGNALMINGNLWTTHCIQVDSTGVGGGTTGSARDGMRFYQIKNMTATPTVVQSGTLFDASATPLNYWVGSIAASGQGHMSLGASYSNSASYAGAALASRYSSDTPGTISSPTSVA